jgi:tRNA-specific 2-thiouridylase
MQVTRIRYRQPLQRATLHQFENGMYVAFDEPQSNNQRAICSLVFREELVGSE